MMADSALLQDRMLTHGVLLRRIVAWFFDLLFIAVLCCFAWMALLAFGLMTLGLGMPLLALLPLVPFCYHLFFLASPLAATPGQGLMGLIVLRNDDLGRPMAVQALVSTLCFYLTLALRRDLAGGRAFSPCASAPSTTCSRGSSWCGAGR